MKFCVVSYTVLCYVIHYVYCPLHGCLAVYCAGPLEKTAADFWSMVWGENSRNIVMVTKTVEGKKVSSPCSTFIDHEYTVSEAIPQSSMLPS